MIRRGIGLSLAIPCMATFACRRSENPQREKSSTCSLDAAIESVIYQQANARKMLAIGHIQVITVGDIRLDGNFPVVDDPADWEKINN